MTSAFVSSAPFASAFIPNQVLSCNILSSSIGRPAFVARKPYHPALQARPGWLICMAGGGARDNSQQPTAKELAKLYGGSYIGTSIALSIVSYATFYVMVSAGFDVRALVNAFGDLLATTPIGRPDILDSIPDTASTAALAYIAHKATSPLRFPVTVAATPVVAKAFSRKMPGEETEST